MPKEKLYPLGIPVSKPFRTRGSRQEAREILGLPSRLPVFLIMTGSMGYGRIEDTIQELVNLYLWEQRKAEGISGKSMQGPSQCDNPRIYQKNSSIHGRLRRTVFKARRFNQHRGRCERRSLDPYRSHSRLRKQERCLFRKTGNVLLLSGTGSAGEVR